MGQISIAIVKRVAFRDATQHFSNVYTYGSVAPNTDAYAQGDVIIDDLVTSEKKLHAAAVSFVYARMWSSGGSKESNEMLYEKPLTGSGNLTTDAGLDRERALLLQWKAGKDSRGRPVYLRKWYHTCANTIGGVIIASGVLANTTALTSTIRNTVAAIGGEFNRVGGVAEWGLVAPSGRERDTNDNPTCHPYFEHHQLGNEWRG